MRAIIVSIAILALCAGAASAKIETEYVGEYRGPNRANVLFGGWDMSDATDFITIDNTVGAVPHFHITDYMPFDGTDHWWCGNFDYDADGGYGHGWDDRLELPAVDCSAASLPVLTFAWLRDSELEYDFVYVQAIKGGSYIDLDESGGLSGRTNAGAGGWEDLEEYGYVLADPVSGDPVDNPIQARFRFTSDGAWSDEGGNNTVGGALHVDNLKIYDYYGGLEYFFDDVNSGSPCVATVPGATGDYWHLVDDYCSSYAVPSWWCGDDADTSLIPGNVDNTLITPAVDISSAATCTLRLLCHSEVPTVDNDYYVYAVVIDDMWIYETHAFWGDFEECGGFGLTGINGIDLAEFLPADLVRFHLTMHTTDNGCGPGAAGGAGINLDDTWFEGELASPVEETSWGRIKRMYR